MNRQGSLQACAFRFANVENAHWGELIVVRSVSAAIRRKRPAPVALRTTPGAGTMASDRPEVFLQRVCE